MEYKVALDIYISGDTISEQELDLWEIYFPEILKEIPMYLDEEEQED